ERNCTLIVLGKFPLCYVGECDAFCKSSVMGRKVADVRTMTNVVVIDDKTS
ncbi:unnamed protein product, partial [Dovyalis caffra]